MKTLIYIFVLLFFANNVYSQVDTLSVSSLKMQSSNSEMISKYRSLLMDNVIKNDKAKSKELYADMSKKFENDYYIALYPSEKLALNLWLGDYDALTSDVLNLDSAAVADMNDKIKPTDDQLYDILLRQLIKNKEESANSIRKSELKSEDKDFLLLLLKSYVTPNTKAYRDTINYSSGRFINDYPKSRFDHYTRHYIRYEYSPKGLVFGMEFYSGATIMNAKLAKYFDSGGVFGFGFIWGIGNFELNTRAAIVFSGLNEDINYNNYIWKKGERAQVFVPELSLSYKYKLNKNLSLSPILGLGWFSAAPYENDKKKNDDLEKIDITSNASPIIGIDLGWNFINQYYYNPIYRKPMFAYYSCNLRYQIQPVSFSGQYGKMDGLIHNISVGIKFGFGQVKRKY